jgi:hypothetical protein
VKWLQTLVTTHSPVFISQPAVIDSLLLAITPTQTVGKDMARVAVTQMLPVMTPNTLRMPGQSVENDKAMELYTIEMVRQFLDGGGDLDRANQQLKKARATLLKSKEVG